MDSHGARTRSLLSGLAPDLLVPDVSSTHTDGAVKLTPGSHGKRRAQTHPSRRHPRGPRVQGTILRTSRNNREVQAVVCALAPVPVGPPPIGLRTGPRRRGTDADRDPHNPEVGKSLSSGCLVDNGHVEGASPSRVGHALKPKHPCPTREPSGGHHDRDHRHDCGGRGRSSASISTRYCGSSSPGLHSRLDQTGAGRGTRRESTV